MYITCKKVFLSKHINEINMFVIGKKSVAFEYIGDVTTVTWRRKPTVFDQIK